MLRYCTAPRASAPSHCMPKVCAGEQNVGSIGGGIAIRPLHRFSQALACTYGSRYGLEHAYSKPSSKIHAFVLRWDGILQHKKILASFPHSLYSCPHRGRIAHAPGLFTKIRAKRMQGAGVKTESRLRDSGNAADARENIPRRATGHGTVTYVLIGRYNTFFR